jgi:hypothetical protein
MTMARIEFKAKTETVYNIDDTVAYQRVKVPKLERRHCDMNAFRKHQKYGGWANSDLFPGFLARVRNERLGDFIRLDRIPEGVSVDTSGFLAVVSLEA